MVTIEPSPMEVDPYGVSRCANDTGSLGLFDVHAWLRANPAQTWVFPTGPYTPEMYWQIAAIIALWSCTIFLLVRFVIRICQPHEPTKMVMLNWVRKHNICCSICKGQFSNSKCFSRSNCNHVFHLSCGKKWQLTDPNCALCHAPFPWRFKKPMSGQYAGNVFRCNRYLRTYRRHNCLKEREG